MRVNPISFNVVRKASNVSNSNFVRHAGMTFDTVSFSARNHNILSKEEGEAAAIKLASSTSGYRSSMNDKFNDKFVYSMTQAVAKDMQERFQNFSMVGGDTRPATKRYAPYIVDLLTEKGIDVYVPKLEGVKGIAPVASPVLALATKEKNIPLSILMTASHNPWLDGGYNFLTDEGAVADDKVVMPLASNLAKISRAGRMLEGRYAHLYPKHGHKIKFNPYEIYKNHIDKNNLIDFENIKNANIDIFYEDFGGTGSYYFPKLMKEHGIDIKKTLSSKTEGPNPVKENLVNLSKEVEKSNNPLKIGLATDGDSDRFGVIDEKGNFIGANDVIMLCAYHQIKNKGINEGRIIKNQATSDKIDALASYFNNLGFNIKVEQTPVGFKYLGGKMNELEGVGENVIIAGEESGGLTLGGHIPEKDGFIAISTILDLVATEKKPIGVILKEVNEKIGGNWKSACINMKFLTDDEKNAAVKSFDKYFSGEIKDIAGIGIDYDKTYDHADNIFRYKPEGDGTKIFLNDGSAILIRKSGTEPVMRLYVDAVNEKTYNKLSDFLVSKVTDMGGVRK